jgi:hypothetical protein
MLFMLFVIMLGVIMLSAIKLSVVVPSVITPNVVAPISKLHFLFRVETSLKQSFSVLLIELDRWPIRPKTLA